MQRHHHHYDIAATNDHERNSDFALNDDLSPNGHNYDVAPTHDDLDHHDHDDIAATDDDAATNDHGTSAIRSSALRADH